MVWLPDVEQVAAKVHEGWMQQKRARGIASRLSTTREELMVPYAQLSEAAKEIDRAVVKSVYQAIEAVQDPNAAQIKWIQGAPRKTGRYLVQFHSGHYEALNVGTKSALLLAPEEFGIKRHFKFED